MDGRGPWDGLAVVWVSVGGVVNIAVNSASSSLVGEGTGGDVAVVVMLGGGWRGASLPVEGRVGGLNRGVWVVGGVVLSSGGVALGGVDVDLVGGGVRAAVGGMGNVVGAVVRGARGASLTRDRGPACCCAGAAAGDIVDVGVVVGAAAGVGFAGRAAGNGVLGLASAHVPSLEDVLRVVLRVVLRRFSSILTESPRVNTSALYISQG